MRAALSRRYGPPEVVEIVEVPRPAPGRRDVLVRVEAAAVTSADSRIRGARFPPGFGPMARLAFGIRGPRHPILGGAFAGVVEAVGSRVAGVSDLDPGDAVCGMTGLALGAHAEHVRVAAKRLVRIPPGVSADDAAGVLFGGSAAVHFLGKAPSIGPGTTMLVNGASGAIGTVAVQLGRQRGATVTGVTRADNAALVEDLGAERTIDHTQVDVAGIDERFDVVFDTVGSLSMAEGRRLLAPGGVLLLAVGTLGETIRARGQVVAGPAPERTNDLRQLLDLVAAGELRVVLDQVLPLDDIVAAHRRVDSGRKVGNLIVRP